MYKKKIATTVLLFLLIQTLTAQENIYLDTSQPIEVRAKNLVSKLTLEEKAGQMMYNSPAIERLDIPAYNWWNEALHGVGRSGNATIFPQAIGLGATFDKDLLFEVSSAISDEARAMYNASSSKGYYNQYNGLTFWTPNVNIFRDPRWGRGQETYGEDPYLTGLLGASFVRGLQGDNPKYLKTAACAKHYAVHSGPEKLRHEFNAIASKKDMFETYLPAFKTLVEANVESVMCAYNRTNDEPCCANNYLIDDVLIGQWGFDGHLLSDCWALVDFYSEIGHGTVETQEEAAALAVKSGVNLNCGNTFPAIVAAVEKGLITEQEVDEALAKLLETRFKLGMFDPKESNPYNAIPVDVIDSDKHRNLAYDAALKSVVMLKNNGVLPLKNDLRRYYVVGPNAASIDALLGNYFGTNPNLVTMLEGLSSRIEPGSQLQYSPGTTLDRPNVNKMDWSSGGAAEADVTFVVMGLTRHIEGEEGESVSSPYSGDRLDYNIPANQMDYLKKIKGEHGKPVVAIITGGTAMNLTEVHEIADAVLMVWYPGEEGGNAVADIVFGNASPSGRLPLTFPKSLDQLPAYEDYSMQGRTYKYMTKEPMYPFGYGLSYAKVEYGELKLTASKIKASEKTEVSCTITNLSEIATEEVVQLYIKDVKASVEVPLFSLKNVERVSLGPNESKEVKFTIDASMLELINNDGKSIKEKGEFKIYVGSGLPTDRSEVLGMPKSASGSLVLK
ncbi:MAG: glycoside hydrolase family 3 C-terminal domain-containing protein [Reichenbachiella sp.]